MNEEQSSKSQLPPETRSNQGPRSSNVTDEGCPVIESGSVCGETKTLAIIREFREIYDNCVQNMEQCTSDGTTMVGLFEEKIFCLHLVHVIFFFFFLKTDVVHFCYLQTVKIMN